MRMRCCAEVPSCLGLLQSTIFLIVLASSSAFVVVHQPMFPMLPAPTSAVCRPSDRLIPQQFPLLRFSPQLPSRERHHVLILQAVTSCETDVTKEPKSRGRALDRSLIYPCLIGAGWCSMAAWMALAVVSLSHHPDPRFINCSWKHNALTMSQAAAFPLSVTWSAFRAATAVEVDPKTQRRLSLGIGTTFLYSAAATFWAPAFACGYDLYPTPLKGGAGAVFTIAAALALAIWKKSADAAASVNLKGLAHARQVIGGSLGALWSIAPRRESRGSPSMTASLYATATAGLLWFTVLPMVSHFPLATIPTILGKRLSRAAGAFTFLACVQAFCLKEDADGGLTISAPVQKTLQRGLGWGSAMHLALIGLKLIGVDDGGLLLPGRGLWEVYPAMLAVPFATAASLMVHACVCMAAFSPPSSS